MSDIHIIQICPRMQLLFYGWTPNTFLNNKTHHFCPMPICKWEASSYIVITDYAALLYKCKSSTSSPSTNKTMCFMYLLICSKHSSCQGIRCWLPHQSQNRFKVLFPVNINREDWTKDLLYHDSIFRIHRFHNSWFNEVTLATTAQLYVIKKKSVWGNHTNDTHI